MFSVASRARWISLLDQVQREVRMGEDELAELRAADDRAGRRLHGDDRRRARRAVERHLADVFAGTVEVDHDLPARRRCSRTP